MNRAVRLVLVVAVLAVLGAGVVLLLPRFRMHVDDAASGGATVGTNQNANDDAIPRTSEELIAGALKKGDITYEESLLQRAYALFDDPRLEPLFRSPVINWHAAVALLHEINNREKTLSAGVLE